MGENNQGNICGRTDFIATTQTLDSTHYLMAAFHVFAFLQAQRAAYLFQLETAFCSHSCQQNLTKLSGTAMTKDPGPR